MNQQDNEEDAKSRASSTNSKDHENENENEMISLNVRDDAVSTNKEVPAKGEDDNGAAFEGTNICDKDEEEHEEGHENDKEDTPLNTDVEASNDYATPTPTNEKGHVPVNSDDTATAGDGDVGGGRGSANHQAAMYTRMEHLQHIASLTGPIIVAEFFQSTLPIVDVAFIGRMTTKEELASAALATVWFNLWNTTMLGFLTSIDTLLAQSIGARDLETFATWSGSSLFIVSMVSVLVGGLVALCNPVMVAFGQDPVISAAAGQFAYRLIPGLWPYYLFKVMVKHLQAQNILKPGVLIGFFANLFNILANWFFISYLKWGLNGAPIATTMTRVIEFVMIVFYFYWNKSTLLSETWPSFAMKNLRWDVLKIFLSLAVASALSFTAEAWSFQITTILAGLLGTIPLDAHTITFSIGTFIYLSFSFAIGIATSIRIGILIGEGNSADAKRSCIVSYLLTLAVQAVLILILLLLNDELGQLFSSDEEVSNLVAQLIPLMVIFMLGDAVQSNTGGVLRGLGRQKLLFLLNIIGFWILALPSGALLTFVADIGVRGLWWGMAIGIYTSSILGILLLRFYINWKSEANLAKERIAVAHQQES